MQDIQPPAFPPVRIALVGLNNHGQTILHAIHATPSLELVVCCDVDEKALAAARESLGVHTTSRYDDVLHDTQIDAVALVTPNDVHAAQAVAAYAHGKHVFVEKPIANTCADARAMIDAAAAARRVLAVGHNTRRRRAFRAAKQMLDAGELGTLVAIEASMARHVGLENTMPGWKADPARCLLLPMSQLGIHFVDAARYINGPLRDVMAVSASRAMSGGAVDAVTSVFTAENGLPVTISAYYATPDVYSFRLLGTDGIFTCGPQSATLQHLDAERSRTWDFSDEGYESFNEQMREFARCCRSGATPETDGHGALAALAAVTAMDSSARTGRREIIRDYYA